MFSPARSLRGMETVWKTKRMSSATASYKGINIPNPDDNSAKAVQLRCKWLEDQANCSLKNSGHWKEGECQSYNGHASSLFGLAKIPMAVAGPLHINGDHAKGKYLAPLAITEGAVVASTNRGVTALNKCGGVNAFTSIMRTTVTPVFEAETLQDAAAFGKWLKKQKAQIDQDLMTRHPSDTTLEEITAVYDIQVRYFDCMVNLYGVLWMTGGVIGIQLLEIYKSILKYKTLNYE